MKKNTVLVFSFLFTVIVSCKKDVSVSVEQQSIDSATVVKEERKKIPADGKYPVMTFTETEYDFGDINQGDKVEHTFEFKNTGESDLVITNARASCGCTVPEYTKEAIKPGENGTIKVTFNSAGKQGQTLKTVTISCNTANEDEKLTIKTNIQVPNK